MKARFLSAILVALLTFTLQSVYANTVVYTANTIYLTTNGTPPANSLVTAAFQDEITPGNVDLTLGFNQGNGSGFSVSLFGFNLASSVVGTYNNTLTFSVLSKSPGMATPIPYQSSALYNYGMANNYSYFDILIEFDNATFVSGDSITFQITSSVAGLNALDFAGLSSKTQGSYRPDNYYVSALIDHPNGPGYFLGAVPEPSTATLGGLGLLGLLTVRCSRKR